MTQLSSEIVAALSDLAIQQVNNGGLNTYPQPIIDCAAALTSAYQQATTTAPPAVFPVDCIPTEDPQAGPPPGNIASADSHIFNAYTIAATHGDTATKNYLLHAHQCCANMGSSSPQWSGATFGFDMGEWGSTVLEEVKAAPTNPFAYMGLGLGLLAFGPIGAVVGAVAAAVGSKYLKS